MTAESDDMQRPGADVSRARLGPEAGALESWLHRTLSERFDATLDETLPAEMTTLLSDLH